MNILSIKAREILDSRSNWTVEVDIETSQGVFTDSAPSGASTGKYEAKIVPSLIAVNNVNKVVAKDLKGADVSNQEGIDKILKDLNVGANATTAVSMAVCRAGAAAKNLPLHKYISERFPRLPMSGKFPDIGSRGTLPETAFNMINGGAHATNELDFQEFMVVPARNASPARNAVSTAGWRSEAGGCDIKKASEIYHDLRKKLGKNVGDEGGFTPPFKSPEEALDLLSKYDVKIIIDVAASQFSGQKKKIYNVTYYQNLVKKYPIIGLEDPFSEDDFENWQKFRPKNVLVIGDDLLATNPERIKMAKEENLCNAMILKINQIGTVSEAIEAARLAKLYGWKIIVSHRSGETNDDFIADFAVGIGADYIKSGAPARGERVAKYNRLLKIEEELK